MTSLLDNTLSDDEEEKVPLDIIYEWELIYALFDYNSVSLVPMYYKSQKSTFDTDDIKRHYYYLHSPQFWGNSYYVFDMYETDNRQFIKRYGKNGIYDFLSYRDGVAYNKKEDIWHLSEIFYDDIEEYYLEMVEEYGKDFLRKYIM